MNNIKPQIVKIAKNILSGSKAPAIELLMGNKYNQNETVRYGRITFTKSKYRVSSKTVPTWLIAHLSATHANCNSWDVFEKFRKLATR